MAQSQYGLQNASTPPVLGPLNLPTQFASIGAPVATAVSGAQQQFNSMLMDAIAGKGIFANQNSQQNKSQQGQGVLSGLTDPVAKFLGIQPQQQVSAPSNVASDAPRGGDAVSLDQAAHAIGSYESGNNYQLQGPQTNGGRALGRYQIMSSNLPDWLREAGMPQMTPQQFLNNKDAQDQLFNFKFGQFQDKYGNFNDAASTWFSGRPLSSSGNARDVLGTTVPKYIAGVNHYLGTYPGANTAAARPAGAPMPITPPSVPRVDPTPVTPTPVKVVRTAPAGVGLSSVPANNAFAPANSDLAARMQSRLMPRLDPDTADATYDKLPSGARFIGPDGKIHQKP